MLKVKCFKGKNLKVLTPMQTQKGSGLIEVIVALFITAIGLLGVLAMQTTGLKSNQRAEFMTEAQMLASDMMNMIVAYNSFDNPASVVFNNLTTSTSLDAVDCSGGCTRAEQYTHDRAAWSQQLKTILPSGYGSVVHNGATDMFTITVMWDAERTGAAGTNCGGDPEVDLTCYILEVQI